MQKIRITVVFSLVLLFHSVSAHAIPATELNKLRTLYQALKNGAKNLLHNPKDIDSAGALIISPVCPRNYSKYSHKLLLGKRISQDVDWKLRKLGACHEDHGTWSNPHGKFFKNNWGIQDSDEFDTAFRKVLSEVFFLNKSGDNYWSAFEKGSNDEALTVQAAIDFLEGLKVETVLEYSESGEYRPNFVLALDRQARYKLDPYFNDFSKLSHDKENHWSEGKGKTPSDLSEVRWCSVGDLTHDSLSSSLSKCFEGEAMYESFQQTISASKNNETLIAVLSTQEESEELSLGNSIQTQEARE